MLNDPAHSIQVHLVALPLTAWGLARLVQTVQPRLVLAGVADSVADSLLLNWQAPPDVVVVDLDGEDGTGSLAVLHAQTRARVLVVSGSRDMALLDSAVLAGACGVVRKHEPPSVLLKAIEKVHEGELWIDRSATGRIFMELTRQKSRQKSAQETSSEKQKIAMLTARERQTIAAVASDASVQGKVFADRLNISEHTLRNHLTSIYSKLGLTNRLDLYAYAHKHGLNEVV